MKPTPVQAAAEGLPKIKYGNRSIDDLSSKVSEAAGFSEVLQYLVEDILGSPTGLRLHEPSGCLMVQRHEAEMLLFMSNQTKWAAELADKACGEVVL